MLYNPEHEKLFNLSTPSLAGLSYVLRHKVLWPKDFKWNFMHCNACAMGLARRLWDTLDRRKDKWGDLRSEDIANAFNMPSRMVDYIFWGEGRWASTESGSTKLNITPEMVADQIDKYLEDSA